MAWPPPTLTTNKTNATAQQDDHPAAHNEERLAINDLVARVKGIGAPVAMSAPGLNLPLTSGALIATINVPAVATYQRLAHVGYHNLVNVAAIGAGPCDIVLRSNGTTWYQWRTSLVGYQTIDGMFPTILAAGTAYTFDVVAAAVGSGASITVLGGAPYHALNISLFQIP